MKLYWINLIFATMLLLQHAIQTVPICQTLNSNFVSPLQIPSTGTEGIVNTSLISTTIGSVTSVKIVNLVGSHEYLSDLEFSLISPDGTKILFLSFGCNDDADFNLKLQDGTDTNMPCPASTGQYYDPETPLSQFTSKNSDGEWTLSIEDTGLNDTGQLISWGIEICSENNKKILLKKAPASEYGIHYLFSYVNSSAEELIVDGAMRFPYKFYDESLYVNNYLEVPTEFKNFVNNPNRINFKGRVYVAWNILLDDNYCNCSESNKVGNGVITALIKFFRSDSQAEVFYDLIKININNAGVLLKTNNNLEIELVGTSQFGSAEELENNFYGLTPATVFCLNFCP